MTQIWNDIPDLAKSFIDACLEKSQDARATASDLLKHEWLGLNSNLNDHKLNNLRSIGNLNGFGHSGWSSRTSETRSNPRSIGFATPPSSSASYANRSSNNTHLNHTQHHHRHQQHHNKKPFLPPISKSPSDEPTMTQKRFKSDPKPSSQSEADVTMTPRVSPPTNISLNHHQNHHNHQHNRINISTLTKEFENPNDSTPNLTRISPTIHQRCTPLSNNHNTTTSTSNNNNNNNNNNDTSNKNDTVKNNINNVAMESTNEANYEIIQEDMESEDISTSEASRRHNINSNNVIGQDTFILPKHCSNKIITKEDLMFSSSSGESLDNRKDSILTESELMEVSSMGIHAPSLDFKSPAFEMGQKMSSYITGVQRPLMHSQILGPRQFPESLSLFQASCYKTINSSSGMSNYSSSGNGTLPPIANRHRNSLFTPALELEKLIESAVSGGTSIAVNHLDDMFTAPKLKPNNNNKQQPGFLRRSRSSSPSNPISRPALPGNYHGIPSNNICNFNKATVSTGADPGKVQSWLNSVPRVCPKALDVDHPKLCNLCVNGKLLTKSL